MGSSRLTWGVGRSVEKSLEQLHVFDVVNINGLFEAHHEPLQDTADYRSLRSNIMEPVCFKTSWWHHKIGEFILKNLLSSKLLNICTKCYQYDGLRNVSPRCTWANGPFWDVVVSFLNILFMNLSIGIWEKQSDLAFEFTPGIVLVLHIESDLK